MFTKIRAASEYIRKRKLPWFGLVVVVVYDALLAAAFLSVLAAKRDPDENIRLHWTLNGIYGGGGALALATIVCVFFRRPRALRLASGFQRWTAFTPPLALTAHVMAPTGDGDQLTFILMFPATVIILLLGLFASKYLQKIRCRSLHGRRFLAFRHRTLAARRTSAFLW